jgi:hypothetical protein
MIFEFFIVLKVLFVSGARENPHAIAFIRFAGDNKSFHAASIG